MAMTMVMVDDHFDGNDDGDGDGDGANDPGVFFPLHCSTTGWSAAGPDHDGHEDYDYDDDDITKIMIYLSNQDNHDQAAHHPVLALEWAPQLVRLVTHRWLWSFGWWYGCNHINYDHQHADDNDAIIMIYISFRDVDSFSLEAAEASLHSVLSNLVRQM